MKKSIVVFFESLATVVLALSVVFFATRCTEKEDPSKPSGKEEQEEKELDDLDVIPAGFIEEKDDASQDIPGTFDYSKIAGMKHPRLLMTSKDFVDLKSKVSGEKALDYITLFKLNRMILGCADVLVEDPAVLELKLDESGTRNLEVSRRALTRLLYCSYAYRMTGKAKYLNKVKSDLEQVCAMKYWHPEHFLDVAEMAMGVAIAYDWLYYSLDYDTRVMVRGKLLEYAIKPSFGAVFHDTYSNWNQVCNSGVIAAALATYEKNKVDSRKAIEDGIKSNLKVMPTIYSPDGNYSEGYAYWSYGTGYETVMLKMLDRVFNSMAGLDKVPGFDKTCDYILFMVGPTGKDFSYADGGSNSQRAMVPMWWFAAYKKDQALLFNELRLIDKGVYPTTPTASPSRLLPVVTTFIKDFKIEDARVAKPSKYIWSGKGVVPVVMIHTEWTMGDSDCYVGIKGGGCNASHSHMDGGSFVFDALGQRWSEDYERPDYVDMEVKLSAKGGNFWAGDQKSLRWDIVKMNSISHSTLAFLTSDGSVDKLHVTDQSVSGAATIDEVYNNDENSLGAKLNLSSLYPDQAESVVRTIVLKDRKYLVVTDVVEAKSSMPASLQWRMLTPAKTITVGESAITLEQNNRKMYLKVSSNSGSAPVLSKFESGRPSTWASGTDWDTGLTDNIVGWSATVPAGKSITFTTTITPDID